MNREVYEAIFAVVHQAWILMDNSCEDHTLAKEPIITIEKEDLDALSEAMDNLEGLVPDDQVPFWGGFPVSYFLEPLVKDEVSEDPDGWIYLKDFVDPPEAPEGFRLEVERQNFMGIVYKYRHVKESKDESQDQSIQG